jgi:hypothetical protein
LEKAMHVWTSYCGDLFFCDDLDYEDAALLLLDIQFADFESFG